MTVDLVCQVVDNYGDIAVVWRLAQALVQDGEPDLRVRLLVDDWEAFRALNPALAPEVVRQALSCPGGSVLALRSEDLTPDADAPADVLVEGFGAPTPPAWMSAFFAAAAGDPPGSPPRLVVHLEYLTAEAWSESYHLLPSPWGHPGTLRYFFVPGFRERTGGLVFTDPAPTPAPRGPEDWLITLFSYEHNFARFWDDLVAFLEDRRQSARVVVCAGRSRAGALAAWEALKSSRSSLPPITVVDLGFVDQATYTAWLAAADFNLVRGEESWVQAALCGRPFLWQAYLQPDGHQRVKVEAFLEVWQPWFEPEGEAGRAVFAAVSREFLALNVRLANSEQLTAAEGYRVFWENRDLIGRVNRAWASELRKNAKLSRRLLEFLKKVRV